MNVDKFLNFEARCENMAVTYVGYERKLFSETYSLFVKYAGGVNSEGYWENLMYDVHMLCSKYYNCELAVELCKAVLDQLEFKITDTTDENGYTWAQYNESIK